jgi:flagellar basal-body rod protein FlgG
MALRSLWTAASGMQAQALNIDVISNNLANVNTSGFKRSRADFQDLLYQNLRIAGAASSSGTEIPTSNQIGLGTKVAAVAKNFSQGDYKQTGNELDLAIDGRGFFQITTPEGEIAYSRAGSFKLDGDGNVVTSDGYLLEPQITIPSNAIQLTVGPDGTVTVMNAGELTPSEVGKIETARFANPAGLNATGKNLFMESETSGSPTTGTPGEDGLGTLTQGYLEMSNVNIVEEMVYMIMAQRAYEINGKAIQTSDEMLQMANNIKR